MCPVRQDPSYDPTLIIGASGYLDDLLDVNTSGFAHGSTLVYSTSVTGWIIGTGSPTTGALNSLADVDTAGATSGQALGYFGSVVGWAPLTVTGTQGPTGLQGATGLQGPAGTGGGTSYLTGLLDVNAPAPVTRRALIYNSTGWIQGFASGSFNHMSGLALTSPAQYHLLIHDGTRFVNRYIDFNVDLSGVSIGSPSVGQVLTYRGATSGWVNFPAGGGTGFTSGANYLDELADVNLAGALNSNQVLLHNGSYWTQSYFGTTNLSNTTGHALVDNDHALVFQPSINKYVSTHVIAAPTGLRSIDSDAQASGNTDIIQARLNGDGGIVYIPTGTYKVNTLYVRGNHIHLFGPGRLLAVTGYAGDAVIVVSGNGCLIEDIAIDGNGKAYSGVMGRGEGIAIVGDNNIVRNVHVYSTPSGGASNAIAVRLGNNNLIESCYVSGAGYAAYYCKGEYNTFRNNTATHFRNKGFSFNGGPYNKLTIDGFYADNPVSFYNDGGTCLQIDPGTGSDQYIRNVDINRVMVGNGGSAGNCAKFAKVNNLNITNSIFYPRHLLGDTAEVYSTNVSTDVAIAEGIENLTISDSFIASNINFSSIPVRNFTVLRTRFGEYMDSRSGVFGSGYNPNSQILDMVASGNITIHDCEFHGFAAYAIDLESRPRDDDPAGYQMLDIQRCHFAGSGAGTLRDINMSSNGAINWSRRLRYFDNTRSAYGGGNPLITVSTWYPYFTPLNLNASEYSGAAAPTSSSTNWRVGDIIRNTTPTTGGNMGWICVQSGAPGTWLTFGNAGNINNFVPTGLIAGTGANNTNVIADWTNLYGYALIPTGEYYIANKINITKDNAKIFGPGTIKMRVGFSDTCIINLIGTGCRIEDVTLDGSQSNVVGVIGLNMVGNNCTARNITVSGVQHHSINTTSGNKFMLIDNCRIYGVTGLGNAIDINNFVTTIKNTYIEGWGIKGISSSCTKTFDGDKAYLTIENCLIKGFTGIVNVGDTNYSQAILIDPGVGTPILDRVTIKNTVVEMSGLAPAISFDPVKIARVRQFNMEDSSILMNMSGSNVEGGLRFAEEVHHIHIDKCEIRPNIHFEGSSARETKSFVVTNSIIGTPSNIDHLVRHSGYACITGVVSEYIKVDNCRLLPSGSTRVITVSGPQMTRFDFTNNYISGHTASNFAVVGIATGSNFHNTNKVYYNNNTMVNGGVGATFAGATNAIIRLTTWDGHRYYDDITSTPTALSSMSSIRFTSGNIIQHTGGMVTGTVFEWRAITGGLGSENIWQPISYYGFETALSQSYFSGVYDVVLSGISNTAQLTGIATQIQALVNNLPDNSTLRFPPGKYWLNKTIHFEHKRNIDILAHGAKFYETPDRIWLNSGTFYFNRCTGIDWHGGSLSGAANLQYILSVASGIEMSGLNFENLALDSQLTRNVAPSTFNMEQCSDFLVDHFDIEAKYRYAFSHRCINTSFINSTIVGVCTGWLNRLDESIVTVGTGTAQKGDIDKETARQSFMFNIIKGYDYRIHNIHAKNCGGLASAGSSSLGGGQGPSIPELVIIGDCSVRNAYDNGIYLGSINKALVHHVQVVCDTGLPHAISAIKARGNYVTFDHCYVEHVHHGYGIEAVGGSNDDYWTNFTKPGFSSQGSKITNCVAVDCRTDGVFLDTNENTDTFPRDIVISDNYFYDCAKGPSGAIPTGFLTGEDYMGTTVICANDVRRVKIYNNIIENTGAIGPDVAIFIGTNRMTVPYITGAEIYNNTFLGCKQGIRLENMSHARVYNNWGERIGSYNSAPYITYSGVAALISCFNVKNSRFYDNSLVETGSAFCLYVVPGTGFVNNIVRDNDGVVEIN